MTAFQLRYETEPDDRGRRRQTDPPIPGTRTRGGRRATRASARAVRRSK